ncbi:mCE-family protein mce1D [Mycobacterium kansasii]|uniref:MCE-family protein mce1D n=1 Tax=Mycobacterium kansasii TaxID=1768 RepID=A0A1V3WC31_MYCKA|nr:mCE-family protein mce1D [Mycobacterium kansasii]
MRSLALFVNALHQDDAQFVALNQNLADLTGRLVSSDQALSDALQQFDSLLTTIRPFLDTNREVLTHDVNNLAEATNTLLQPEPLNGLETALHVLPTAASNVNQIYHPSHGSVVAIPEITSFANPMQFICSSIQAASRLGYQESAELCAQYLAPILDSIKFNYFPFGVNFFSTAEVLPKQVAYSEPRLQPPNGYKDTTVPGIWVPDTPLSHRNTQPGWIVAPGMQGQQVGPITAGLMTPSRWPNSWEARHRARSVHLADATRTAERLRRVPGVAADRFAGPGADTAAAARPRGDPGSGCSDARSRRRTGAGRRATSR